MQAYPATVIVCVEFTTLDFEYNNKVPKKAVQLVCFFIPFVVDNIFYFYFRFFSFSRTVSEIKLERTSFEESAQLKFNVHGGKDRVTTTL